MVFVKSVLLYFFILLSFVQQFWWLGVIGLCIFSWFYGAGWLIFGAFLLDAYFGNFYAVPFYSIITIVWFLLFAYLRPRLMEDR